MNIKNIVLGALLVTAATTALSTMASAQWRDRHWRGYDNHRPYVYTAPGYYYYAPPPAVYYPAPVYPGFSLNFGF